MTADPRDDISEITETSGAKFPGTATDFFTAIMWGAIAGAARAFRLQGARPDEQSKRREEPAQNPFHDMIH